MIKIDPSQPIKSWRTAWRRALKDAGLELRFHDLRHCCITKLSEGQASEQTLMAIAGHVSRKMLERYSHIRTQAKQAAIAALERRSEGGSEEPSRIDGAQNWAQSHDRARLN